MQQCGHMTGQKSMLRARRALVCCQAASGKEHKQSPLHRGCSPPQLCRGNATLILAVLLAADHRHHTGRGAAERLPVSVALQRRCAGNLALVELEQQPSLHVLSMTVTNVRSKSDSEKSGENQQSDAGIQTESDEEAARKRRMHALVPGRHRSARATTARQRRRSRM
jgi:hypothetical protein